MDKDNKYHPFTKEEFDTLKSILITITNHIPTDKAGWVWNTYKRLNPQGGSQPCQCGSAASYWKNAVDTIRNYVNNVENA